MDLFIRIGGLNMRKMYQIEREKEEELSEDCIKILAFFIVLAPLMAWLLQFVLAGVGVYVGYWVCLGIIALIGLFRW
jgi:hypothetical protein